MTALARAAALSLVILGGCATAPRPSPAGVEPDPSAARPARAEPPPDAAQPLAGRRGAAPSPTPPAEPAVRTVAQLTLGAVGDVLMHEAVKTSAATHGAGSRAGGFPWLWAPIADLLAAPDLTIANLETPVAPRAGKGTRPFVFNAPPEVLAALRDAGVDAVHLANNHAFDQGREGFEETVEEVRRAGLAALGAGEAPRAAGPVLIERNGISLALLGWAHFFNAEGNDCPRGRPACLQAGLLDRERAVEEVRAAAAGADAVVVVLHWGDEYATQPRAADVELARRLADAGALAVIGHHPHVLQPVELYRRADGQVAAIAYSLGNFVSNQSRSYVHGVTPEREALTRDGALLRVTIVRRDYGRGVTRVELAGADWLPLWTENDTAELDRRKEPARRPAIRVVATERALAEVRAAMAAFPDPVPPERAEAWVRLRRREALLASRLAATAAIMGAELRRELGPGELAVPASPPPPAPAAPTAAP